MARHAAGVAQAEVNEHVSVDIPEARTLRPVDEHGIVARPASHPVHRHTEQQRALGILGELPGSWVTFAEGRSLSVHELPKPGAIDLGHGSVSLVRRAGQSSRCLQGTDRT